MAQLTPDEIAAEAAQRPRAAYFAFAAGILSLLGGIGGWRFQGALPSDPEAVVDLLEAMQARLNGNAPPTSLLAQQTQYIGDHIIGWAGPTIVLGLGILLMLFPLNLVWRATRARKDDLRSLGWSLLLVGGIAIAVAPAIAGVSIGLAASDFDGTSREAAEQALGSELAIATGFAGELGKILFAVGLVILALNAMRVGLFTRFVGVLGIIVALFTVLRLPIDQIYLLRSSWFVFVGLILLGKMPGVSADPPAWARGEAIPWPTQQEVRERLEAERAMEAGANDEDPADGEPPKRSRKRRK